MKIIKSRASFHNVILKEYAFIKGCILNITRPVSAYNENNNQSAKQTTANCLIVRKSWEGQSREEPQDKTR